MARLYINLEREFYNDTLKRAEKEAIKDLGDEAKDKWAIWNFDDASVNDWEINDEGELVISMDTKLGYFSMTVPLTNEMMESLISLTVKRLNKFKSLLESLK